jgi:hypothetical protein
MNLGLRRGLLLTLLLSAGAAGVPLSSSLAPSADEDYFDGLLAADPAADYRHNWFVQCVVGGWPQQNPDCTTPATVRDQWEAAQGEKLDQADLVRAWVVENKTHFSVFLELARLPPDLSKPDERPVYCSAGTCFVGDYLTEMWRAPSGDMSNLSRKLGGRWQVACFGGSCGDNWGGTVVDTGLKRYPPNLVELVYPREEGPMSHGRQRFADKSCAGDVLTNFTYAGHVTDPYYMFTANDNTTNARTYDYTVKFDGPECERPPEQPLLDVPPKPRAGAPALDGLAVAVLGTVVAILTRRKSARPHGA